MRNWMQNTLRYSTLAGVTFVPIAAQEPVNEGNIALIVFFVAVGLTLLLAGGLALLLVDLGGVDGLAAAGQVQGGGQEADRDGQGELGPGMPLVIKVPSPNCPYWLLPQAQSVPSVFTATVCL